MRFRATRIALTLALTTIVSCAGIVGLGTASAGAATNSPISIALVCTCSGPGGPEYQGVPGAFRARIDMQNANGGVNGHKISTIVFDDQTNPTQASTAVQEAVSHGVLGIVSISALFFEGAKYANQASIPVTGSFQDGPEWGQQPYTNMFASDAGSVDPKYPVNTGIGKFLVSKGGKVVAAYGYGISPSSTRSAIGTVQSVIHAGGKQGVLDTSVPFGGSDFTTAALVAKSKNVTGLFAAMDDNSNFALATAMKQAGVKLKAVVFPTGYEPSAITSPAWTDLQGDYFASLFRPFQLPNAATNQMKAALQKYDGFTKSQFPTFEQYEAWVGADLMIKGMQLSGKNPTSAGVITSLRHVTSYNAGGLLPSPINYSTIFGHDLPRSCEYYLQAQSKGYVPVSTQPICGTDIPGTTTVTGS
ncbi:MAG TPA: ABC transporter substrate-binding protein [Acidimicrobiales bacterium]|jgi:branched-chain amino acid transport system substrate-binding protein|nr:ABC transporter substrate-binding protein [Acidimicrobiales bacterium]